MKVNTLTQIQFNDMIEQMMKMKPEKVVLRLQILQDALSSHIAGCHRPTLMKPPKTTSCAECDEIREWMDEIIRFYPRVGELDNISI